MALALDARPTTITLVLRDLARREIKKEFVVPISVWNPSLDTIAALATIRDNLVTAYNAITNALVYRAFMTIAQTDDTDTLGPAGSNLNDIASVVCNLETAGKSATVFVPAAVDGVFQGVSGPSFNQVDPADAALLTFLEFYTTTDGSFTLSDGETIADTGLVKTGKRIAGKVKAPVV